MSDLGASGEATDLWLDEELFMDVQLQSGEWVEAECVKVQGRWILVRFFSRADLEQQWINVDTDTHRLAELHTKSGAEAQRAEAQAVADREAMRDAAARAAMSDGGIAAAAGQPSLPASASAASVPSAHHSFNAKVARDTYVEVLQRNQAELHGMLARDGDQWVRRRAEQRFHAQSDTRNNSHGAPTSEPSGPVAAAAAAAYSSPPPSSGLLTKSMSELPPYSAASSSAAAASSLSASSIRPAASSPSSSDDDLSLFTVSAVSIKQPLFDSLTRCRLVVPVRARACVHPEAFDLWTHIQLRIEQSDHDPVWTCSVCKKEAWSGDLEVDPILFHAIRCLEDGRMQRFEAEVKQLAQHRNGSTVVGCAMTPDSWILSADALKQSLASIDELLAHPPTFGCPSSSSFEERRLTLAMQHSSDDKHAPSLRITLSTESDDTHRIEARRHMQRRARTMPLLPHSGDKRKAAGSSSGARLQIGADADEKPLKRQRMEGEEEGDEECDGVPASSAAAMAALAASSSSAAAAVSAAAVPSSSAASVSPSSFCPWPSWVDADGLCWVDVREDPADCEPPDRWARIKVKLETARAAYQAVEQEREQMFAAPPPLPSPPLAMPVMQAVDAASTQRHMQAVSQHLAALPPEMRKLLEAQGYFPPGLGDQSAAAAAAPAPAAAAAAASARPRYPSEQPTFSRASTLPTHAASAASSPASPAPIKRRKKLAQLQRSESSAAAPSASSSSSVPASAVASAPVPPLQLDLNRCSERAMQQIDGVGPKVAAKLVAAREAAWMMKKVKYNDAILERRQEAQSAGGAAAGAEGAPAADSLCECARMDICTHVRPFKNGKSLLKIEGIPTKLLQRIRENAVFGLPAGAAPKPA